MLYILANVLVDKMNYNKKTEKKEKQQTNRTRSEMTR